MSKPSGRPVLLSLALASLVAVILVTVFAATHARPAAAQATDTGPTHAQTIVNAYLNILNSGMQSGKTRGSCTLSDFSALATVYAPDATVRATAGPFTPGGPFGPGGTYGQQEFDGLAAITGFYTKLCNIVVSHFAGAQWHQDVAFLLSPNVLNSYEHVNLGTG